MLPSSKKFDHGKVDQRRSTNLTDVEQLDLLDSRPKKPCPPVDLDYLLPLPSLRRAIRYSVSLRDLEPKQVFEPLGMDKAVWSRIENGGMSFPADELLKFQIVTENDAPLLWLMHQAGYDVRQLRRLRDDKDRRITELEAELAAERAERAAIAKFVRETMR